ncbi:DUF106 domain-containing protein [Candidatus Woesearchaeota archaeon]|jgi:uncharacterized membrane protein (DUF106 family)|nr:DUF106 domain-containing protein [Candidatus Woesearchaeota archaeon]MBT4151176.1 DUF106 domain-containing protein [Candidatus Woesearchaeota archaeon]MBT4247608.1 DUF106 domain-containing protein [Candidatus Woesearchaeota archaeon]MBT4433946.1 DUF106 domain-containing protein [Candidatus Woesearchaeota archaeon]
MATSFLDPVLSPIFQPLLNSSPFWTILLLALIITLIITIVYKYMTNQQEMKRLKDEQKDYQKRIKALRDQPTEAMKLQKEAMKKNMDYMKHSMKATLITFLPIILIFGWMNAHLGAEPIFPGETYSVTADFEKGVGGKAVLIPPAGTEVIGDAEKEISSDVTWQLKSTKGEHLLKVKTGETEQTKNVLITKDVEYTEAIETYDHSDIKSITINYNKLRPLGDQSLLGWQPGWLGLYIIFSIVFSIGLRKLFKVY